MPVPTIPDRPVLRELSELELSKMSHKSQEDLTYNISVLAGNIMELEVLVHGLVEYNERMNRKSGLYSGFEKRRLE